MAKKTNILDELFDEVISSKEHKRSEARMLLARKIDMAIKVKGWNKTRFAKEMQQNNSAITRWLSGTHNFTSDTLSDIQEVLGVKLLDIEIDNTISSVSCSVTSKEVTQDNDFVLMYNNSSVLQSNNNQIH